jgi:amino acid permease
VQKKKKKMPPHAEGGVGWTPAQGAGAAGHHFSPAVAICFTLNYVVGTGFLTLPAAVYSSGLLLGSVCIFVVMAMAAVSQHMLLSVMARGQKYEVEPPMLEPLLSSEDGGAAPAPLAPLLAQSGRKVEIVELCRQFGGVPVELLYSIALCLYLAGSLWTYGSVFATSLAEFGGVSMDTAYFLYLGLLSLVVVPLSCLELEEQIPLQVALTAGRLLVMFLMVAVIAIGGEFGGEEGGDDGQHHQLVNWKGLGTILPSAVFASAFHHSLPALVYPIENKKHLGGIFDAALLIACACYVTVSVVVAYHFGSNVASSANLNFEAWVPPEPIPSWVGDVASTIISLFPALDVLSAYPLNAITLGSNVHAAFMAGGIASGSRSWRTLFRLSASIPPLVGAALYADIGWITNFTGLAGFIIIFIIPAGLHWVASGRIKSPTAYDQGWLTRRKLLCASLVGFTGVAGLGVAIWELARNRNGLLTSP